MDAGITTGIFTLGNAPTRSAGMTTAASPLNEGRSWTRNAQEDGGVRHHQLAAASIATARRAWLPSYGR
jgi:hypothetical protein